MKNIIFDWSGVVRDTITNQLWIVNRIFEKYGVDKISLEEFKENWKQPPVLFYQKYLPEGYNEEERIKFFRELQLDPGCPKAVSFPGVVRLIQKCKKMGYFLAIVSSDFPETLLVEVKDYGLENVFNEIITDSNEKLAPIQKIIKDNSLNLQDTFFVGDSNHEIEVAKSAGIKSIAVTWGFTNESKLKEKSPDYVAINQQALEDIIFNNIRK